MFVSTNQSNAVSEWAAQGSELRQICCEGEVSIQESSVSQGRAAGYERQAGSNSASFKGWPVILCTSEQEASQFRDDMSSLRSLQSFWKDHFS